MSPKDKETSIINDLVCQVKDSMKFGKVIIEVEFIIHDGNISGGKLIEKHREKTLG